MRHLDLRSIARALNGEVSGFQVLAPGPGHSPRDRSLSVKPDASGAITVHSFCGDDWRRCKDYVRERLGPLYGTDEKKPGNAGERNRAAILLAGRNRERALAIWQDALHPRGSPVETYLKRRGVRLPNEAAGEAIRFHPSCPFMDQSTPAMVCLVRDAVTNDLKGMHRTALTLHGQKASVGESDRLSLGPIVGGAIKLTPDHEVTTCLGIGEGIESTLSLRQTPEFGPSPVWSLVTAGGIENFAFLPGVECLWIAVDNDSAGNKAAGACAARWQAAGREVFLVKPSAPRLDLNDLLSGGPNA